MQRISDENLIKLIRDFPEERSCYNCTFKTDADSRYQCCYPSIVESNSLNSCLSGGTRPYDDAKDYWKWEDE